MFIKSIRIENFRSVRSATVDCHPLTALLGANGSGKSAVLRALELFYSTNPQLSRQDYFNHDTGSPVVIAVTFTELSAEAQAQFQKYVQDETLTVERVFIMQGDRVSSKLHGSTLQHDVFAALRDALELTDRGATAKVKLQELRDNQAYATLPAWGGKEAVKAALTQWEEEHLDQCSRHRDDGQFFGFGTVGQGFLGRYSRFLLVPAVRDAAADALEGRGAILTVLLDLVVRSALSTNPQFLALASETQRRYEELMTPIAQGELRTLSGELSGFLGTLAPEASVELKWLPHDALNVPLPKAGVELLEDGFSSTVESKGHGLQRAFIITMLRHLTTKQKDPAQRSEESPAEAEVSGHGSIPNLVLAIEEPELYQHPSRQRHFAKILRQLAEGLVPGVAARIQIVYCTHSPLFVGLDRFDQIRVLKKAALLAEKPKESVVKFATLQEVAQELWGATGSTGQPYTAESLAPRLQAIMTPWMNEGFFASTVVLVEGENDRAAILGMAAVKNVDLDAKGVAVIPCGGKESIDRPLLIFRRLGIPVFIVWDSDKGVAGAQSHSNRLLLRILGQPVVDWPDLRNESCACFPINLESTMAEELGSEYYNQTMQEALLHLHLSDKAGGMKNPLVHSYILEKGYREGKTCPSLNHVIDQIVRLCG